MGGYYWFPTPTAVKGEAACAVLTCHDLGFDAEVGHVDLWPAVIDRLAAAWGRDAGGLRRRLTEDYTGLPRGRVTRPGPQVLILHGKDAPVPDWQVRLMEAFKLWSDSVRFLFDEHEQILPGDHDRLREALGLRFG